MSLKVMSPRNIVTPEPVGFQRRKTASIIPFVDKIIKPRVPCMAIPKGDFPEVAGASNSVVFVSFSMLGRSEKNAIKNRTPRNE